MCRHDIHDVDKQSGVVSALGTHLLVVALQIKLNLPVGLIAAALM